jgi:hypothetical protein
MHIGSSSTGLRSHSIHSIHIEVGTPPWTQRVITHYTDESKKRLVLEGIAYIAYIAYINGITSMHEMHEIIAADALTPAARCRHRQQHQWQQQGASPNRGQVVKVNWTHEMTHVKHQVQPLFFLTHWDSPVSPSTTHFTKMV